MTHLQEVELRFQPIERFAPYLDDGELQHLQAVSEEARRRMAGRVFWNVSSTAVGGGVAEMLRPLISYSRGTGVDARWLVIEGDPDFFRVTKRLHHSLHGEAGDGSPLDDDARRVYEATAQRNAIELIGRIQPRDVVLLHDPQTAGLAPHLRESGAAVVWRCHIGHDAPGDEVERGWRFLEPYLAHCARFVFSRRAYVPAFCDHGKSHVIRPSIDAFATKNVDLDVATVHRILRQTGLVAGEDDGQPAIFPSQDGSPRRVESHSEVLSLGPPPTFDTPLVVQVSRWDPLKDPVGVMNSFAQATRSAPAHAHLILAGPDTRSVTDDPEGAAVFEAVVAAWRELSDGVRRRVHLASLPMDNVEENAAIVNALQRHATIVVQKSLHEGFGLTVTEAMWKARPVIASAVGGIQDQIEDGISGVLLRDPRDAEEFAEALSRLLEEPETATRLGNAARERVRRDFLGVRHLTQYADMLRELDAHAEATPAS